MEIRYGVSPRDFKKYDTQMLRDNFLIENLFIPNQVNLIYSHIDRIIVGGVVPQQRLYLEGGKELGSEYFLERRELGIINIGNKGMVYVDGQKIEMNHKDGLYVGKESKEIIFESEDPSNPAKFYLNSAPAHEKYPLVKINIQEALPEKLGTLEQSNKRTIYKFIHPAVCKSCQLVMGMTLLEPGCVWNTMPSHTHDRRMEVYLYFNMEEEARVFHMMGEPQETRHLVMGNEQAVISPSWSIHSGVGTTNYTFIWGMVGENQVFSDMDHIKNSELR